MNRWTTFRWLCDALRPHVGATSAPSAPPPWPLLVEAASHHLVTPALGFSLATREKFDGELQDYLAATIELTRARNREIMRAVEETTSLLAGAGVPTVLLKGAAILAEHLYPDSAMRILGDIDLLVPASDLLRARALLEAAGWRPMGADKEGHHHLAPLKHPDHVCMTELHHRVLDRRFDSMLLPEDGLEQAVAIPFQASQVLVPHPTHQALHGIVHEQLVNRRHATGVPLLRQMLDLCVLRRRFEDAIDWPMIEQRFAMRGRRSVLSDTLAAAEAMLAFPAPPGLGRPKDETLAELRKAVEARRGLRRAALRAAVAHWSNKAFAGGGGPLLQKAFWQGFGRSLTAAWQTRAW